MQCICSTSYTLFNFLKLYHNLLTELRQLSYCYIIRLSKINPVAASRVPSGFAYLRWAGGWVGGRRCPKKSKTVRNSNFRKSFEISNCRKPTHSNQKTILKRLPKTNLTFLRRAEDLSRLSGTIAYLNT